ncbi:MAG: hypothetical protein EOP92_29245 [Lysobacteraceae bacterium]|nr:MAG: hypothetical protein EOP92_29245 [Xanthomonadaceae bacterium]
MPPFTATAAGPAIANRTSVWRLYGVVVLLAIALGLLASRAPETPGSSLTAIHHTADAGFAARNPVGGGFDGDAFVPDTSALQPSLPAHESAPASPAEPDDNRETAVRLMAGVVPGPVVEPRFSTRAGDRRRARSGRGPPLA